MLQYWSFDFWLDTFKDTLDILDECESSSGCFFLVMKRKLSAAAVFCVSRKCNDCFLIKCPRKRKPRPKENNRKPQSRRGNQVITKWVYIKIVAIVLQKVVFTYFFYFLEFVRYNYIVYICSWFPFKFSIERWCLFFKKVIKYRIKHISMSEVSYLTVAL